MTATQSPSAPGMEAVSHHLQLFVQSLLLDGEISPQTETLQQQTASVMSFCSAIIENHSVFELQCHRNGHTAVDIVP